MTVQDLGDGRRVAEVHPRRQLEAHVGLQTVDEVIEFRQVLLDPPLHQGGDGAGEEVDDGLLAAAHAGAVAGDHGLVVGLIEEQGLQGADLLVEIVDADEVWVGGRQVEPEGPFGAHFSDGVLGLGLGHQGAVCTDLDTFHAALTGVGVDGDAEQAAAALLLLLPVGPIGLGDGQLEAAQGLQKQAHLFLQGRLLLSLQFGGGQGLQDRLVEEGAGIGALAGPVQQFPQALLDLPRLAAQVLGGHPLLHPQDGGVEDVGHGVDQAGDGGVRAGGEAAAAGGAVLRQELGILEADLGHVAVDAGGGRHQAHGHVRIRQVAVTAAGGVEVAGLAPEAVDIGHEAVAFRQLLKHDRQLGGLVGDELADVQGLVLDLDDLVEAAAHHPQVVLHHPLALAAELGPQLILDGLEQAVLVETSTLHEGRGGEEGALEGVALHAELKLRVRGLVTGDLEAVDVEDVDLLIDDEAPGLAGDSGPHCLGVAKAGLDDEDAALLQPGQGVGVGEDIGVRRHHHVDVGVLAVEADGLRGRGQEVGGGLALFLRAVLGVGADVEAQQVVEGHGQVLAGGHGPPAAHRVHAHRDGALGQQVGVLAALEGQAGGRRVGILEGLEADLILGVGGLTHEVHRKIEELLPPAGGEHVLDGGDQALGLEVAGTQAVAAGIESRHVARLVAVIGRVGERLVALDRAVLQTLGEGGANLAHDGQILRQGLVGPLQHRHATLALEQGAEEVAGEGTVHGQVDHANLELAGLAQVVGYRLGLEDHAALAQDQVLGVLGAVASDTAITTTSELVILVHHLVGQGGDVLEEVGPLSRHRLHVGVLVLHRAGLHGLVHVPDLGDAAAGLAVNQLLGRGRTDDDVIRAAEEFGDQFPLRHHQGLDEVSGEKAVLGHRRRGQGQLGDLVADEVEVRRFLGVLTEDLEEAGVVDAVVIVVGAVDIETGLGDGAAADIEHVR